MKLKDFLIVVPVALSVLACSKSSDTPVSTDNSGIVGGSTTSPGIVTNPGPSVGPTGTSGASGATGGLNASGCPLYPSHAIYSSPVLNGLGTGSVTPTFPGPPIVADNKLRVSIKPSGAGTTNGTGGTANYNHLSANVHLMANGIEVGMITIPTQGGNSGYSSGLAVGVKSDPAVADFSSYLQGGNTTYSLKVDNIRTDYKCNTFCTAEYYGCYSALAYGYCGYGSTWNWDYHQANWACCPGSIGMLDQCQRQQCGVGTVLDNSSWSLSVQVETDSTPCITP
ncbi:MAG: hypothetical protein HY074_14335 [Deltaproteobacteria bacterium]|nr:hypothetical protein [Deltaproteobacteria bacterium]